MSFRIISAVTIAVALLSIAGASANNKDGDAYNQPIPKDIPVVGGKEYNKTAKDVAIHDKGPISPQLTIGGEPRTRDNPKGEAHVTGGVIIDIPEHRTKDREVTPTPSPTPFMNPFTNKGPATTKPGLETTPTPIPTPAPAPAHRERSDGGHFNGPGRGGSSHEGYTGPDHASDKASHTA